MSGKGVNDRRCYETPGRTSQAAANRRQLALVTRLYDVRLVGDEQETATG
jgi:hypothetical protein